MGQERRVGTKLASVSRHWQGARECFLVISPHDDDAVLGAGLLIQLARREKVPVHILIVTDGCMGYCTKREAKTIADIRREESVDCYGMLKVPRKNIIWAGYPDCALNAYRGRIQAAANDPLAIAGFIGLQNSFTFVLRAIRPTQCFLPTCNDLHPDHRIVYDEFMISLFHASSKIWPELGRPLVREPHVSTYAVYCDFPAPPTLRMCTPPSYLDKKLAAMAAFRSQRQISSLIKNVRAGGAEEYVRAVDLTHYHPTNYHNMFEEKKGIRVTR